MRISGKAFRAAALLASLLAGCASPHPQPVASLPARLVGEYLVVEAKWDDSGPYRFIVDTGSTVSLVSPELAKRYPPKRALPQRTAQSRVRVRSAAGPVAALQPTELSHVELDSAVFENVPALIYDCTPISAHLGIKIDGILGFPLFRDRILTLDYPHSQIRIAASDSRLLGAGSTIEFNNSSKTPVIPVRLGGTTVFVLVDSGSDGALSLNPTGLNPEFAVAPRDGPLVDTLTGPHAPRVGRLAGSIQLGDYELARPLVEVTDELSSIGGAILRNFTVTFNQRENRVTFFREPAGPVGFPALRSVGISFTKEPVYWRVVGTVAGSPAAGAGVQVGDLITRINGDPVTQWGFQRFEELLAGPEPVAFTFFNGNRETEKRLPVFDLVP